MRFPGSSGTSQDPEITPKWTRKFLLRLPNCFHTGDLECRKLVKHEPVGIPTPFLFPHFPVHTLRVINLFLLNSLCLTNLPFPSKNQFCQKTWKVSYELQPYPCFPAPPTTPAVLEHDGKINTPGPSGAQGSFHTRGWLHSQRISGSALLCPLMLSW